MLEFLGEKAKANEEDASLVIAQLVETLSYLHKQNVVHLDIRVREKAAKVTWNRSVPGKIIKMAGKMS